ncbi:DUF3450 domain-containing protein [Salinivibrio costicola]|uniref:DUF3450 domain-containing protein n=1 Tax=Salinivibrio costicola TaxID=51367 RepID=A0ABX6KB68_SALCS|nr:DUF3450 domain-containing protein [Salinivibrio costicola]
MFVDITMIKSSSFRLVLGVASCLAFTPAVSADQLEKAQAIEGKTTQEAAQSQSRINRRADASLAMRQEIEQIQTQISNLEIYRDHLQNLVSNQQVEAQSLRDQIIEIKETRQGIVPLMYRMLDGLEQWIAKDMPLKAEQRQARLEKLQAMMGRADVADSEKFRRILEAYQIERDYGTKLDAYQDTIALDGRAHQVDVLHLGRVSLVARSLDGKQHWVWSTRDMQWVSLDASAGEAVDKAFAVAQKQVAPSLLSLPLSANQGVKS